MHVLALLLSSVLLVPTADVSNPIVAANPSAGSRIADMPSGLAVALDRPVSPPVVLTVTDPSGKVVSSPQTTMIATNVTTDLDPGLPRGTYTVTYRLQTERGPEGGSYQFVYGAGGSPRGLSTWTGYSEVPEPVALPEDDENAAAAEGGEDPNQPEPTTPPYEVDEGAPPDVPEQTSSSVGQDETDGGSLPGWVTPLLGLLLLAGAGGAVVVLRRRSAAGPDSGTGTGTE